MRYSDEELATWNALNQLNLTEFLKQTMPTFMVIHCRLNLLNCQFSWKLRETYLGTCLELDTRSVKDKVVENENKKIKELYSVRKSSKIGQHSLNHKFY